MPNRHGPVDSFVSAAASDRTKTVAVLHGVLLGPIAPTIDQRRAITVPTQVLGHGMDLIHSFSETAEISEFLDRVWTAAESQNRGEGP
jgi:hypothetical protein